MGFAGHSKARGFDASLDPFEIYDDAIGDLIPTEQKQMASLSASAEYSNQKTQPKQAEEKKPKTAKTRPARDLKTAIYSVVSNRLIITLFVLVAGVYIYRSKPWSYFVEPDLVYAYFEVRAVDADGRPIAGALVKNSGKKVGTTDSFGEWRRYMRVPLGGTVPISLTKRINAQALFVTKNFAIPPFRPEKSEIELRSSVQLLPSQSQSMTAELNSQPLHEDTVDSDPKSRVDSRAEQDRLVGQGEFRSTTLAAASSSAANEGVFGNDAVFKSDHDAVWFEVPASERGPLAKEVLPALMQRAREVGLRVERGARWTVHLTNLVDKPTRVAKDGGGLILVTSMEGEREKTNHVEFLRNYQENARSTARGLLFALINHASKNVLLLKSGNRWAAVLPKKDPTVWQLSPQKRLRSGDKLIHMATTSFSDDNFTGFYLQNNGVSPCVDGLNRCTAFISGFTENPPVANWVKLRLKHPVPSRPTSSIFISGYPARSVGNDVFEYWGMPKSRANVTVVENKRLVLRGFVLNTSSGFGALIGQNLTQR